MFKDLSYRPTNSAKAHSKECPHYYCCLILIILFSGSTKTN